MVWDLILKHIARWRTLVFLASDISSLEVLTGEWESSIISATRLKELHVLCSAPQGPGRPRRLKALHGLLVIRFKFSFCIIEGNSVTSLSLIRVALQEALYDLVDGLPNLLQLELEHVSLKSDGNPNGQNNQRPTVNLASFPPRPFFRRLRRLSFVTPTRPNIVSYEILPRLILRDAAECLEEVSIRFTPYTFITESVPTCHSFPDWAQHFPSTLTTIRLTYFLLDKDHILDREAELQLPQTIMRFERLETLDVKTIVHAPPATNPSRRGFGGYPK
jgi:hypothetical protein